MGLADRVTFGGDGLDRAAHLRADHAAQRTFWGRAGTRVLPLWRGKPLFAPGGLGWIAATHRLVADRFDAAVFLGLSETAAHFAVDLPDWTAAAAPEMLDSFLDTSEQRHPDLPEAHGFAELRREMTRLGAQDAACAATARAILGWHGSHRFCARCGSESRRVEAGWQRHCPCCDARHFPRIDPVVIMLVTEGNSVLLGRSPGWPAGMYSLLAGFVEPGETIEAAVRREVAEEVGLRVGAVAYLASQPWPFPASLMLGCRAQAEDRALTLDPAEIEDALWVSREEILAVFAGESTRLLPAREGAIAQFLLGMWLADRLY